MSDRDDLIRSLGTITLEAGWIDVCGDLGDLLDAILAAGWRAPEPIRFGRWYRTRLPDGSLWAETSNPTEGYLAHTDPSVSLTWERITVSGDWVDWPDHPTDLVHPSTLDDEYGVDDPLD